MKRLNLTSITISAILGFILVFSAGCGGDSGDDKKSSSSSNSYSGSSTLEGTISLSGLSTEDSALLGTTASSSSAKRISAAGDAVVKLFVLDDNGDLADTGLTCSVETDGTYTCPNIADNQDYIVRYIKDLGNGKVLEMKSTVSLAAGATSASASVNPVTTMITASIMDAVSEALTGVVSDQALIKQIIASVKTAVETTVSQLIRDGVIKVPSLVSDGSIDDYVETENEGLDEVSGAVLTDDGVTSTLDAAKSTVKGAALEGLTNREKIKMIFEQMIGDGGGAPEWFANFIADKWDSVDNTMTFEWLSTMALDSLEVRTDELGWMGIDSSETWVDTMASDITTAFSAGLTGTGAGSAFDEAKTAIAQYHTIKAKTTKTEADLAFLAEFPSIIGELFPQSFIDTMGTNGLSTQFQNTGQMTAYLIFLIDSYAKDVAQPIVEEAFTANNIELFGDQAENIHLVDISPEGLLMDLGFVAVASNYYGLYFDGWIEIRSEQYWDTVDATTGESTQSNILRIETGVENPEWFMVDDAGLTADQFTAKLKYPSTDGTTKEVDMDVMVESETTDDGTEYKVRLNIGPDWSACENSTTFCEPTINTRVEDHATGDYVITVTHDGMTATKTIKNVFILNDPENYRPKLTSPRSYPQWPGENATQEELDAFQAEEMAFWQQGISVFAPNNDNNTSLVDAVFKWEAPDMSALELPENIGARYQVGISQFRPDINGDGNVTDDERDQCNMDWESCNTEIYNTWWQNRAIKGTSFSLPVELAVNSEAGEYNIGVQLVFIDKLTGREMAMGGHTWANFKVGVPPYTLTGNEDINISGTVTGTLPEWIAAADENMKVALIAEQCTEGDNFSWTCTSETITSASIASGSGTFNAPYELSTTVGAVKENMESGKNINLIVFNDKDDDDVWDQWTEATDGEASWWLMEKWFWFETWGDFRINVENGGFNSYPVGGPEGASITGFDFEIQ